MLIQSLIKCYDVLAKTKKVPPIGWSHFTSNLLIADIDIDGNLKRIDLVDRASSENPILIPFQFGRTSGVSPYFMCDQTKYFLGLGDKVKYKTASKLHIELLRNSKTKGLKAVYNFFTKKPITEKHPAILELYKKHPDLKKTIKTYWVQFSYKGKSLIDLPELIKIWNKEYKEIVDKYEKHMTIDGGKSLLPTPETHPKIKGRGCGGMGATLVGFNQPNAESYNKSQNYNAPISAEGAFKYTSTLSYLLRFKGNNIIIGSEKDGDVGVYWSGALTLEEIPYVLGFKKLDAEERQGLADAVKSIKLGQKPKSYNEIKNAPFTFCILHPNNSRLGIKSIHVAEIKELITNLTNWYGIMKTTPYRFISEITITGKYKDMPAPHIKSLFNFVLFGKPLSGFWLNAPIQRYKMIKIKNDKDTYGALRNIQDFIKIMFKERRYEMDKQAESCGRLFALCEYIQRKANNQNTIGKLFKPMCEAPGSVVVVLIKRMQSVYIPMLEGGMKVWAKKELSRQIELIDLPTLSQGVRFDVSQQASFITGYANKNKEEQNDGKNTEQV